MHVPARLVRLVAVPVAALLLASCSAGGDKDTDAEATPTPTPTPKPVIFSPLTGEQLESQPKHPVVIVKVDNTAASSPQIGLGKADLITEELVEGGITRLAVFYYSKVPGDVGPVRSMRASDIGIVKPLDAVLVASGGAPQTVARVAQAGITTFTEGDTGFYRDRSRRMPYNLFNHLTELVATLDAAPVPSTYLPFAKAGETPALPLGRKATTLTTDFGYNTTSFEYLPASGAYRNTDSHAAQGGQFNARTVLALRVQIRDAGYTDPAGNPVPETHFTGTGDGLIFTGGRVIRAHWTKNGLDAPITLSNQTGVLSLPQGKVWMGLVPVANGDVTFQP